MIFDLIPLSVNTGKLDSQLACCNNTSSRYGLTLTKEDMQALEKQHIELLKQNERVEFGTSSIVQLVEGFASSPYMQQDEYAQNLADLQECFYELRSAAGPDVFDDEIIDGMRLLFDGDAGGAVEMLANCSLEAVLEAYDTNTGSLEERQREIVDYDGTGLEQSVPAPFNLADDFGLPAATDAAVSRAAEAAYEREGKEAANAVLHALGMEATVEDLANYELSGPDGQAYRWNPDEWEDDISADGWDGERWSDDL